MPTDRHDIVLSMVSPPKMGDSFEGVYTNKRTHLRSLLSVTFCRVFVNGFDQNLEAFPYLGYIGTHSLDVRQTPFSLACIRPTSLRVTARYTVSDVSIPVARSVTS